MTLERRARQDLQTLCHAFGTRRVGSDGNRAATAYFDRRLRDLGYTAARAGFDCLDWSEYGVDLVAGGARWEAFTSPLSPACGVQGPLTVAASLEELEGIEAHGRILLLHGPLAAEPLMPKNFPFFNPQGHQRILQLLERQAPLAILTAGTRLVARHNPAAPVPMIEDGDFDIPSAYLSAAEGERLAALAGSTVALTIRAERRPARGENVSARRGPAPGRLLFMAHIDAKGGTPGALDNAAGIVVLLLLAELLADADLGRGFEILAVNGEDDYASPGERLFLRAHQGRFGEIALGVNLDGVGDRDGPDAYSLYNCGDELAAAIRSALGSRPTLIEGPAWPQGDHMLLVMNGVPALAFTAARVEQLLAEVIHTPRDTPDRVDPSRLAALAQALCDLAVALEGG